MKILIIDCGHGIKTSGKRCMKSLDSQETREWTLNNKVGVVLQRIAQQAGITVFRVDDTTGATDVALKERCERANDIMKSYPSADIIYISIHFNAGANGTKAGGVCVKYTSSNEVRIGQARRLYNLIIGHTQLIGNRKTPVQYQTLYVCRNTNMPALLVELGFMDSAIDVPIILTDLHINRCAQAICDFVERESGF